jgi:hypothetical protein
LEIIKVKDKVKTRLSMWRGDIGTVSGIIDRENYKYGDLVHVIFPETDKHYGYQQSFDSKDLIVVVSVSHT